MGRQQIERGGPMQSTMFGIFGFATLQSLRGIGLTREHRMLQKAWSVNEPPARNQRVKHSLRHGLLANALRWVSKTLILVFNRCMI